MKNGESAFLITESRWKCQKIPI